MATKSDPSSNSGKMGIGMLEEVDGTPAAKGKSRNIFIASAVESLRLVGWCFRDPKQSDPPSKTITLVVIQYPSMKEFRLTAHRFDRKDVAEKYRNRNLDTAGFVCETAPKALATGLYLVEAIQGESVRTVLGDGLIALI
jgi:hypothetical protein